MITVIFTKNEEMIRKVSVEGHASYGDAGMDIVCAGISILTITILNGLIDKVGITSIEREIKEGYTSFSIPKIKDPIKNIKAQTLLETYEYGVLATESAYADYITVKEINGGELND